MLYFKNFILWVNFLLNKRKRKKEKRKRKKEMKNPLTKTIIQRHVYLRENCKFKVVEFNSKLFAFL